jgi:hypothetical protein
VSTRSREWRTFLADVLFILVVISLVAQFAPILRKVRFCSWHAWQAGEGVSISYSSLWALLANLSTTLVSSFNHDSLNGNLGFGLRISTLVIHIRGNNFSIDAGLYYELNKVFPFFKRDAYRAIFIGGNV